MSNVATFHISVALKYQFKDTKNCQNWKLKVKFVLSDNPSQNILRPVYEIE